MNLWSAQKQSHPRAIEIIQAVKAPLLDDFRGLDDEFWHELLEKHSTLASEFVDLLMRDFPTFCALLYTVVPKAGTAGPFLFNRPQRLLWNHVDNLIQQLLALFIIILKSR